MAELNTAPNLADPDAVYARLVEAHRGLSDADSRALNARLVLLFANHVGDAAVIDAALRLARQSLEAPPPAPSQAE